MNFLQQGVELGAVLIDFGLQVVDSRRQFVCGFLKVVMHSSETFLHLLVQRVAGRARAGLTLLSSQLRKLLWKKNTRGVIR